MVRDSMLRGTLYIHAHIHTHTRAQIYVPITRTKQRLLSRRQQPLFEIPVISPRIRLTGKKPYLTRKSRRFPTDPNKLDAEVFATPGQGREKPKLQPRFQSLTITRVGNARTVLFNALGSYVPRILRRSSTTLFCIRRRCAYNACIYSV